jgi:type IV pilus assembly protein PilO
MALSDQLDLNRAFAALERLRGPQKAAVLGGIALAMVVLYSFAFFGVKRSELDALQSQLEKLERDLVESRAVAANLSTFTEELENLSRQLDEALEKLPDSAELPVLLTDITSVGKKSGLEFRSFRPRSELNRNFYAEVPIDIELQGSYHNLGLFLDRVAHLPRIVRINEVSISLESDAKDPPMLKVKGVAETFRFIEAGKSKSGGK